MTTLYRLVQARHARGAFTGEAAQRFGGRWNPPGFAVVYTSQSRALAVLETFVHLTLEARDLDFLLFEITLPKDVRSQEGAFNGTKESLRSIHITQAAGRQWLVNGASLALAVPSILVSPERNYVLNVNHPQFSKLPISKAEKFSFDERLWKGQ